MNKLTRTLAGIMAMATMLSFASCSKKEIDLKGDNSVDQSSAIQQMVETSYKAVEVDADLPFVEVNSIMPIGNTGKLLASGYAEDEKGMYNVKDILPMPISLYLRKLTSESKPPTALVSTHITLRRTTAKFMQLL